LSGGNRQKTSGCPMTQPSFQSGVFDVQSYRYSSLFGAWSYQRARTCSTSGSSTLSRS